MGRLNRKKLLRQIYRHKGKIATAAMFIIRKNKFSIHSMAVEYVGVAAGRKIWRTVRNRHYAG